MLQGLSKIFGFVQLVVQAVVLAVSFYRNGRGSLKHGSCKSSTSKPRLFQLQCVLTIASLGKFIPREEVGTCEGWRTCRVPLPTAGTEVANRAYVCPWTGELGEAESGLCLGWTAPLDSTDTRNMAIVCWNSKGGGRALQWWPASHVPYTFGSLHAPPTVPSDATPFVSIPWGSRFSPRMKAGSEVFSPSSGPSGPRWALFSFIEWLDRWTSGEGAHYDYYVLGDDDEWEVVV